MENENKRYEELKSEILKCIDKDYKMPKNIPLPFGRSVLLKQLDQVEVKTGAGILMGGITANNVMKPNIGIVIAVGPGVPDYIMPGLRVYFNQNVDLEYLIGGAYYKMTDYGDVYAAIPEGTLTSMDTKDDKQVMREKKVIDAGSYEIKRQSKEEEAKDARDFLKSRKNTIILPGDINA